MKRSFCLCAVLMVAFLFAGSGAAMAKDLVKVPTCWMPEFEAFLPWYAKEKGWDKEEGLDLEMIYFESGMFQLETLPSKQWVFGGTGGVPIIYGALRHNAYMIGLANDESLMNSVFVRPDSPITQVKGWRKDCPELLGSPETVKGKTFLVTTVSSGHFAMTAYLKALGLKDSDVVVKQMDQASIMAAFEAGIGDFACTWAPYSYKAAELGWVEAANVRKAGVTIPCAFIGDKEFCDKNPEIAAKFLRIMFRSINKLAEEGATDENIKLFQRMYKEWAGMELSYEDAKKDIEFHPVWKLEEQLQMFDPATGQSKIQSFENQALQLYDNGRLTEEELAKILPGEWVTDKFLKMVETPIPPHK